jgi:hypothetical protein
MAKKLVAVTGIKHNGVSYAAGETLPSGEFTKDELKTLHDNGALVVEDDAKPEDVKAEEPAKVVPSVPSKEEASPKK